MGGEEKEDEEEEEARMIKERERNRYMYFILAEKSRKREYGSLSFVTRQFQPV